MEKIIDQQLEIIRVLQDQNKLLHKVVAEQTSNNPSHHFVPEDSSVDNLSQN